MSTTLKFDLVDRLALSFLVVGLLLFSLGLILDTRALGNLMQVFVDEWTPGLVIDGLLLLVVNRIIRNNERSGVLAQVASLSNDFALDAVRRARTEGWLEDGSMRGRNLRKAKLNSADLSGASFTQTDFGYADLSEASLTHANLRGANLTGANLQRADLRWADLRGAKLRWANLLDAHLDGARFDDADLTFASVDQEFAATHKNCGAIVGGYLRCEQVNTIRKTFAQIECAGEAPIRLFYQKLFEARPELQAMFSSSQQRQSQKFLQSLKIIVGSLGEPEKNIEVLEQLGKRHAGYGVTAAHYDLAGGVLLATLAEFFGDAYTTQVKAAWQAAFSLIANVMMQSAAAKA